MNFLPLRYGKPLLTALAMVSVLALLVATLWPLNPTIRNEVSWLNNADGVRFGSHGTMFSAAEYPKDEDAEHKPFSLEFWMEPGLAKDSSVMAAFYAPGNPQQFIIRQDESDVVVVHATEHGRRSPRRLIAGEAIEQGKKTLITITAGPAGTTLYINGSAQRFSPSFGLSRKDVTGELVVGNSPVGNDSWSGVLRGIAIYKNELNAEEAANHYAAWLAGREETALGKPAMLALYRFRERSGDVAKNEIQPGIDLRIPKHYRIWRHNFMEAAWKEFTPTATYVKDVVVNVAGFIPLGLVLFPYFQIVRGSKQPWLMSCLTGAILSLVIEILQSLLPTRYSGWTDVITNSTGAALGASVYFLGITRPLLRKVFGEKIG